MSWPGMYHSAEKLKRLFTNIRRRYGFMKTYRLKAIIAESLITEGSHNVYAEVSADEVLEALRLETSLFQDRPTIFGVPFPAVAEFIHQYDIRGGKHPITVGSVKAAFEEHTSVINVTVSGAVLPMGKKQAEELVDLCAKAIAERDFSITRDQMGDASHTEILFHHGNRRISERRTSTRRENNVRRRPAYQDRWIHSCPASAGDNVDWASKFCPDCGTRRTTIYDRRAPIPCVNWDRREKRRRLPIERRIAR